MQAIADADLPETVKKDFFGTEANGRLKPMSVKVTDLSQVADALVVFLLKKRCIKKSVDIRGYLILNAKE